jgi:hypothetical protein
MSFIQSWPAINSRLLVTLFLIIVISESCKRKDSEITIPTQDANYSVGTHYTDTITVTTTTTFIQDSTISSNTNGLIVGAYKDSELGNVWCNAFSQLKMARENVQDHNGATVNSTSLMLDYVYVYGDTNTAQTLEVYELANPLDVNNYYTISNSSTLGTKLGEVTITARPNTASNYITIPLSNTYGQELLLASAGTSNNVFVSLKYGIAIVPKDKDKGAIIGVLFGENTVLKVNYTPSGSSTSTDELYTINGNSLRYFNGNFDRSGTAVAGLTSNYNSLSPAANANKLYLQSMMGLKIKVTFPYLSSFLKQDGKNVLVNKAYLELPFLNGVYKPTPPSALMMLKSNTDGTIYRLDGTTLQYVQNENADQVANASIQALYPDTTTYFQYRAQLASHFLGIQLNKLTNNSIYVSPFRNSTEVSRSIIDASKVKLKVYYTVIK